MGLVLFVTATVLLLAAAGGYFAHSRYGLVVLAAVVGLIVVVLVSIWLLAMFAFSCVVEFAPERASGDDEDPETSRTPPLHA